ncbi:MAG: pilin [Patescibacteria group bacterium]
MKTKITKFLFFSLLFFVANAYISIANAGDKTKGEDCESFSECQTGLDCVPCASVGAKCLGNMCWAVSPVDPYGSAPDTSQVDPYGSAVDNSANVDPYGSAVDNSQVDPYGSAPDTSAGNNSCPDPKKEYRDYSGNCVPYEAGYEAPPTGYDPTNSGVDVYGNRPGFDCSSGVCFPTNTNLPDKDAMAIVTNILNWLLGIFGILAIISFVISGIQYILSSGNEKMIDTAKRNMTWSIVGIVVALSGLIIVYAVDNLLRGTTYF